MLYSLTDRDVLLQIAHYAFWEANEKFDITKVDIEKDPENVFIAFAAKTINGRFSDYLRKHYKNASRGAYSSTDTAYDIPDESPELQSAQMLRLLEDHLSCLSSVKLNASTLPYSAIETQSKSLKPHKSPNTQYAPEKNFAEKVEPLKEELMTKR